MGSVEICAPNGTYSCDGFFAVQSVKWRFPVATFLAPG